MQRSQTFHLYLVTDDEDGLDDDVDDDGGLLHRATLPAAIAIACNRVVGTAGDVGALKVVDSQTIMVYYLQQWIILPLLRRRRPCRASSRSASRRRGP